MSYNPYFGNVSDGAGSGTATPQQAFNGIPTFAALNSGMNVSGMSVATSHSGSPAPEPEGQWSSTTAQVARQLDRERKDRMMDVDTLKRKLNDHEALLSQIAEQLLNANFDAHLRELKNAVAVHQQQQDVQAAALREGLISIEEQRRAVDGIAKRVGVDGVGDPKEADTQASGDRYSKLVEEMRAEVQKEVMSVRESLFSQVAELVSSIEQKISAIATERGGSGDRLADTQPLREVAQLREIVSESELRTEELRKVSQQCEHGCVEILQAMEMERTNRQEQASQLVRRVDERDALVTKAFAQMEDKFGTLSNQYKKTADEQTTTRQQLIQVGESMEREISLRTSELNSQLEDVANRNDANEASFSEELRRVAGVVDVAPWASFSEELRRVARVVDLAPWEGILEEASKLRGDIPDYSAQLSTFERCLQAAEARESELKNEVALCSELGKAAAQEASCAARAEQAVAASAATRSSGVDFDVEGLLSAVTQRAEKVVNERLPSQPSYVGDVPKLVEALDMTRADVFNLNNGMAELPKLAEVVEKTRQDLSQVMVVSAEFPTLVDALVAARSDMQSVSEGVAEKFAAQSKEVSILRSQVTQLAVRVSQNGQVPYKRPASPRMMKVPAIAPGVLPMPWPKPSAKDRDRSVQRSGALTPPAQQTSTQDSTTARLEQDDNVALNLPASTVRSSVQSVPAALHGLSQAGRQIQQAGRPRRQRALIVGSSYASSHAPLFGCSNDTWNMVSLFRHTLKYSEDQVRHLLDSSDTCPTAPDLQPTRAGILNGLKWLVHNVAPGDELFFYFAGYGTQQRQAAGSDQYESCLVPSDFLEDVPLDFRMTLGHAPSLIPPSCAYRLLRFADLAAVFASLPAGCRVTVVLDCALGLLPGVVAVGSADVTPACFPKATMKAVPTTDNSARGRYIELPELTCGAFPSSRTTLGLGSCPILVFAAGDSTQPCLELNIEGVTQGAFTWAWIKALIASHLQPTIQKHCDSVKAIISNVQSHISDASQVPCLSTTPVVQIGEGLLSRDDASDAGLPASITQRGLPPNQGRRKALVVGINYGGSHAPLKGCVNDAWNIHALLRQTLQYEEGEIHVMIDEEAGEQRPAALLSTLPPTKANLQAQLNWLFGGARAGDDLLFAFCGYGAQQPTAAGSSAHEAFLAPADFAADLPPDFFSKSPTDSLSSSQSTVTSNTGLTSGYGRPAITPLRSYRLLPTMELSGMIATLPAGVRVTLLLDCSYSILPYVSTVGSQPVTFPKVERGRVDYRKLRDFVSRPRFLELPSLPPQSPAPTVRTVRFPECRVHCFSACRNAEWNAEMPIEGTVQGAFTWAFVKAFAAGNFTGSLQMLQQRLERITSDLKLHFRGVEQTPVLQLSRTAAQTDQVLGI